jgi:predicted AlkP superfamily pyrophosphatase or phosphodiesterase
MWTQIKRWTGLATTLCVLWCAGRAWAAPVRPSVLLISIDGLRPDYVLEADKHGLKIPNLRRLRAEGAFATGVRGVLPTLTFPSHATLMTGASPQKHGIYANTPFDAVGQFGTRWNWYFENFKVATLWQAAAKAGLTTANVRWPISVGAPITWNLPHIYFYGGAEDMKLFRLLSTPGLAAKLEQETQRPYPDTKDDRVGNDERFVEYAERLLTTKRPGFMTVYLSGLDTVQHETAPLSPEMIAVLERIDTAVGTLRAAAERTAGKRAIICVVSDHGFISADKDLKLRFALRQAGLLDYDKDNNVTAWRASTYLTYGSGYVILNDPKDEASRAKVREVLAALAADPQNGIEEVIEEAEIQKRGGNPNAAFYVTLKPGFRMLGGSTPPLLAPAKPGGAHGYAPTLTEMNAAFFIVGPGITAGRSLGEIDLRDVAPTLAGLMRAKLPDAEGKPLQLGAEPKNRPSARSPGSMRTP